MNPELISILKTVAPGIATALGGPLAGAATAWIANKLGLEESTVESVTDAIRGIDPIKRLELEQDFNRWFLEHQQKELQIYINDVQDARKRDAEFVKAGKVNQRANFIVGVTFVGILACLTIAVMMSDLNEFAKSILNVVIGVLLADWKQITAFEFGTTRSSAKKDDTINKLTKGL